VNFYKEQPIPCDLFIVVFEGSNKLKMYLTRHLFINIWFIYQGRQQLRLYTVEWYGRQCQKTWKKSWLVWSYSLSIRVECRT